MKYNSIGRIRNELIFSNDLSKYPNDIKFSKWPFKISKWYKMGHSNDPNDHLKYPNENSKCPNGLKAKNENQKAYIYNIWVYTLNKL